MNKPTLSEQEILQRAIEKAINNGWDMFGFLKKGTHRANAFKRYYFTNQCYTRTTNHDHWSMQQLSVESEGASFLNYTHISVPEVIFSHDFAKAFFGEDRICELCGSNDIKADRFGVYCGKCHAEGFNVIAWQHHLQQMVLEQNPLRYIERFI